MKTRLKFVANSSSSSFVVVYLGDEEIFSDGDTDLECCGGGSMDIDEMLQKLQEAKAKGITKISFEHGGGYDG